MIKTSYLIRVSAIVATLAYLASSAPESGEHGHLFRQLCELVNLAERPAPAKITDAQAQVSYLAIAKLNASVAPQSWRDTIASKTEGAAHKQQIASAPAQPAAPDPREEYWKQAAAAVKDSDTRRQILQTAGLADVTEEQLANYRRQLNPIAEHAFQALQHVTQLATGPEKDKANDALKALKIAAYGRDDFTPAGAKDTDCKGQDGTGTTRQLLCGAPNTDAKANTIAQFMLCVCGVDGTDNNKLCESSQSSTAFNPSSTPEQVLKDLLSKCPQPSPKTPATAAEVQAKATALINAFQQKGKDTYYGFYTGTGCSGKSNQGICVMYKAGTKQELETLAAHPWLSQLQTAAKLLHEHEQALSKLAAVEQTIAAAAKTAYALKSAAIADERHSPASEQKQQADKTEEKQPTNSNCSDTAKKTATECKSLGCDHDEKENKCKPKAGTEDKVAGTGDGAAGTTSGVNCSKHTKKEDCEKENVGLAQGDKAKCGWIEEKCRDSSFLINKQFALSVVSAAFVALLF
uniref:Variant surface glycoprotein n=1 Tax=Trypanosoma brucei TaxID=5691 RepID=S5G7S3_9TRYP|nr:variant surface glycoprotein [Trypanosoma brucei]